MGEALGNIRTVQSFAAEGKELKRYNEKIGDPDDRNRRSHKNKGNNSADTDDLKKDDGAQINEFEDDTTYDVGVKKQIATVGFYTIMFGGAFGFLYCTLWYGFRLVVVEKTVSLGGITAFQSYVFMIGAAIGQFSNNLAQLVSAVAASGRVFYLLEREPQIKQPGDGKEEKEDTDEGTNKNDKKVATTKEHTKAIVP